MVRLFVAVCIYLTASLSLSQQIRFSGWDATRAKKVSLNSVYIKNLFNQRDTTIPGDQMVNLLPLNEIGEALPDKSHFILYRGFFNLFDLTTRFIISSVSDDTYIIKIYNVSGEIKYSAKFSVSQGNQLFEINTGTLPSGIYIVAVSTHQAMQAIKMLKIGSRGTGEPRIDCRGITADRLDAWVNNFAGNIPRYMFVGSSANCRVDTLNNVIVEDDKTYQFEFVPLVTDSLFLVYPLTGDSIRDRNFTFDWMDVRNALRYEIWIATDLNFENVIIKSRTNASRFQCMNRLFPTVYYWKVRMEDTQLNWHGWSDSERFRLPEQSIDLIFPQANGSTNGTFKWTEIYYAASYQIMIDDDTNFTIPNCVDYYSPTNRASFPDSCFNNTSPYYVKIRVRDHQSNWHPWSPTAQFSYSQYAIDTLNFEWITINSGLTFTMGDSWGGGDYDERPTHRVTLSSYQLGKYEVTNEQYVAFLNAATAAGKVKYSQEKTWSAIGDTLYIDIFAGTQYPIVYRNGIYYVTPRYRNCPVYNVTWYGAKAFCDFFGWRLPTEAEWERAARGPDPGRKYPWGSIPEPDCNYLNFKQGIVFCNRGQSQTVGRYSLGMSAEGCYDLAGNVWEWCFDRYSNSYYNISSAVNPQGPLTGSLFVLRGGSWTSHARTVRSTYRGGKFPWYREAGLGFRIARSE